MKLLSILLGLGLAGVGLAAPATRPYQVITTEDGIPLVRPNVVRVDVAFANTPNAPSSHHLSAKLSKYASEALELLRLPVRKFPLSPVFTPDADRVGVMADPNGDLVAVSYGGRHHAKGWRHKGKAFRPYPRLSLTDCLPFLILAISLSVVVACSFLRRLVLLAPSGLLVAVLRVLLTRTLVRSVYKREFELAFDSALAEKGIHPQGTKTSQSTEEQPATMDRL